MIIDSTLGGRTELDVSGTTRIYLCGVTVYDESHIGHARTVIVFDVLRRHIESLGGTVHLVQNFTDVDDKIISRADHEGVEYDKISSRYIAEYHDTFDALNVLRAREYPRATEHMGDILDMIRRLVEGGAAYVTSHGVYFDVPGFERYGRLSGKNTDELVSGARIDVDAEKRSPLDFALWKLSGSGPSWDSPWGAGRPGWHIECSAMSARYLGGSFEIHGGGRDLIFPHHENEIAQSESCTGCALARVWMHVGMVTIRGEKMSKSAGNVRSARSLLERWGPNVIRLFCTGTHYSKPVDYSEDLLREHRTNWNRVRLAYHMLIQADHTVRQDTDRMVQLGAEFDAAIRDDLNTHLAQGALLRLATYCLGLECGPSSTTAEVVLPVMERMMRVLGLQIRRIPAARREEIREAMARRDGLRSGGRYAEADRIRDALHSEGIEINDESDRSVWMAADRSAGANT